MTASNRATVCFGPAIASVAAARLVLDIHRYGEVMGPYELDLAQQQIQTDHLKD